MIYHVFLFIHSTSFPSRTGVRDKLWRESYILVYWYRILRSRGTKKISHSQGDFW